MSCVLKIIGEDLDVDAFVAKTGMDGFDKSYKGDWTNKSKKRQNRWSAAAIITSEAGFENVKIQMEETIAFLTKFKDNLKHIATFPGIQFATIDFGVDLIIDNNHLTQSFYFTKPLIKICAELEIEVELSIYEPDLEVILEKRQLNKADK